MFKRFMMLCTVSIALFASATFANPDVAVQTNTASLVDFGGSGDVVNVTLTVINSGTSVATGTTITYQLDSRLSYLTTPVGWSVAGQTATLNTDIAIGASVSVGFTAQVNNHYSLVNASNTLSASAANDSNTSNNSSIASLPIGYAYTIDKVISTINGNPAHTGRAVMGDVVEYTYTVTNSGTMPLDMSVTDIVSGIGSLSFANPQYNQVFANVLPAGGSASFSFTGQVSASSFVSATNTANVVAFPEFSRYQSTLPLGGSTNASVTLLPQAVLQITKNPPIVMPQPGTQFSYTILVENTGTTSAVFDLFDDLPVPHVSFVSMTRNGTNISPSGGSCAIGNCLFANQSVAAASTNTYIMTVAVQPGAASTFVNTGMLQNTIASVQLANTSDTASVTLAGVPDLYTTKTLTTAPSSIVFSGDTVSFNVTVGNSGTQDVVDVIVTDTFGSQLVYVGGTLGGITPTQAGNTLTFTGLNLNAGQVVGPNTLTFQVVNVAAEGQNFTNEIRAALPSQYPAGYETDTTNNVSQATGTILGGADIYVTKTLLGTAPTLSGDQATYQITVGNHASATANLSGTFTISDSFPSSLYTYVSSSLTPVATGAGIVQWNIAGNWAPGFSQTFTVTLALQTSPAFQSSVTNTGSISFGGAYTDKDTTNQVDAATFLVGGSPDLSITKTGPGNIFGVTGQPITYTITYENIGTSVANNVQIVDVLPQGVTPVLPITGGGVYSAANDTITWTLSSVTTGTSVSWSIPATLDSSVQTGSLINTVTIDPSSSIADPDRSNNESSVITTITNVPDPAIISKSIQTMGASVSGSVTTFVIDYINNGTLDFPFSLPGGNTVLISDTIPSIFTYNGGCVGGTCTVTNGVLTADVGLIPPGGTGTLLVPLTLNTQPVGVLPFTNVATIRHTGSDGNLTNNTGTVSGQFSALLDVDVTKTASALVASGGVSMQGAQLVYTVTVANNGDIPVTGTLTDTWPVGFLTNPNATLSFANVGLAPNTSQTFTFTGNLIDDAFTSFTNTATYAFSIGSTGYTATGSVTTTVPAPVCGNQILENNEQCEIIAGNVYSNSSLLTGQQCVACQIRTTSILNVAQMCVGPNFTDCNTSSVLLPVSYGSPFLTIDKSVTPSVGISSGDTITYTIAITNTGADPAVNVLFEDIWPWSDGVVYNSHTTSPNFTLLVDTVAQTMSGTIPTINPGQTYTITFNATVQNAGPATITNTAQATYVNGSGTTTQISDDAVIAVGQGSICNAPVILGSLFLHNGSAPVEVTCEAGSSASSSTQIQIDCGNGTVLNGLGTSFTSTCNYTNNGSYSVSCRVDGYTDGSCDDTIVIQDPQVSICGDGVVGQFEQCDLGSQMQTDVFVTIGNTLGNDLQGNSIPAGSYEGDACFNCAIINDVVEPPVCNYTDSSLSLMPGELLPFRWSVDIDNGTIDSFDDCDAGSVGDVIRDSMICEFALIHNHDGERVVDTITFPCDQDLNYDIFDSFDKTTSEFTDVDDAYGRFLLRMNEKIDSFGEYKIRLEKIHYNYCGVDNGSPASIKGIPFCRVCETNFAVTRPYLMQIGATSSASSDDLEDFYDITGEQILSSSELNDIQDARYSDYDGGGNIASLLSTFINKYDALAVGSSLSSVNNDARKVPGKNIFVLDGNVTYDHSTSLGSATIIVKNGDLLVKGDVPENVLFVVPDGEISFEQESCSRQTVKGIFVAGDGFAALDQDDRVRNDDEDKQRCNQGGLTVEGVLVGDNIEDLVRSKRSQLNHWFTFLDDNFGNDARERDERRDEIFYGASVLLKHNVSLWSSLPPGASEVVSKLDIEKR